MLEPKDWVTILVAVFVGALGSVIAPLFARVRKHGEDIAEIKAGQMSTEELSEFRAAVIAIARLETTIQANGFQDMRRELTELRIEVGNLKNQVNRG